MPQTKASESSSAKISTKSRKNLHNNDVSASRGGVKLRVVKLQSRSKRPMTSKNITGT
jgi:hypothetical protein